MSNRIAVASQLMCHVCHSSRSDPLLRKESGFNQPLVFHIELPFFPKDIQSSEQKLHLWLRGAEMNPGHHLWKERTPESVHACAQIDIYQIWMWAQGASGPHARSQLGLENRHPIRGNIRSYLSKIWKTKQWNGCVRFWHGKGFLQPITSLHSHVAPEVWQHGLWFKLCVHVCYMKECFPVNINCYY